MPVGETARLVASLELNSSQFNVQKPIADVGKLETSLGRIGGAAVKGAQSAVRNLALIGGAAAGAVATIGIASIKSGLQALAQDEQLTKQTQAVIRSTGGVAGVTAQNVTDLANSMEDLTTVDDKVIRDGENILLTFTNIGKGVFPDATKAMTDLAVAMAGGNADAVDLQGTAIQLGKALNDPVQGITALTRVGVSFTEEQKKQIKAMVDAGNVAGAQRVILGELEREFGSAGAAAGTGYAADMRRLKDAVEGAQMALAQGFLPILKSVTSWLNEKLRDPKVIQALQNLGTQGAALLDKAFSTLKNFDWKPLIDAFNFMKQGAQAALDLFQKMPDWVKTAIVTGWGLNKLTGGALGNIVSELGKGLIKGVLGMNAAVVNVKGAVVNAPGGASGEPGASPGGFIGKLGASGSLLVDVVAPITIGAIGAAAVIELGKAADRQVSSIANELTPAQRDAFNKALSDSGVAQALSLVGTDGFFHPLASWLAPGLDKTIGHLGDIASDAAQTNKNTQPLASLLDTLNTTFSNKLSELVGWFSGKPSFGTIEGGKSVPPLPPSAFVRPGSLAGSSATGSDGGTTSTGTPFTTGMAGAPALINTVKSGDGQIVAAINKTGMTAKELLSKFDQDKSGQLGIREVLAQQLNITKDKLNALLQQAGGSTDRLATLLGISKDKLTELVGNTDNIVGSSGRSVPLLNVVASHLGLTRATLLQLKNESGGWNAKLAGKLNISYDQLVAIKNEAEKEKTAIDGAKKAIQNKNFSPTIVTNVKTTFTVSAREIAQATVKYITQAGRQGVGVN